MSVRKAPKGEPSAVAARFRDIRGERSAEEMASFCGVTRSQITQIENDYTGPSVKLVLCVADVFGLTTDQVLARAPLPKTPILFRKKAWPSHSETSQS